MPNRLPYNEARAALLAAGIAPVRHFEDDLGNQVRHRITFRVGSHMDRIRAKEYIRIYLALDYDVEDIAFYAQRHDDHLVTAEFSTDWK